MQKKKKKKLVEAERGVMSMLRVRQKTR
jgi:hypothetical protein